MGAKLIKAQKITFENLAVMKLRQWGKKVTHHGWETRKFRHIKAPMGLSVILYIGFDHFNCRYFTGLITNKSQQDTNTITTYKKA